MRIAGVTSSSTVALITVPSILAARDEVGALGDRIVEQIP